MLKYADTPRSQEVIRAVIEHGSERKAAAALGISRGTVSDIVRRVKRLAAKQADSPEHDLTTPVAPGFHLRGNSNLYVTDPETGEKVLRAQWIKTALSPVDIEAAYREAVKVLCEEVPRTKPTACVVRKRIEELLNCYVITDYHLGMMAWHEETRGEDWDTKIAEDLLVDWFAAAIAAAPAAKRALFAQLGDFLHWDGMDAVTPTSGNILDADTRFQKLVRVAIRAIRRVVAMLLQKYERVDLIMAEGNHDMASSVWLRELFSAFYENEPRVTVDLSPDPYYCVEHGKTSLFFHHGHKRKPATVDDVFVSKFREVFGRTKHSYGHTGHLHFKEVKETNLMIIEQHRTLASKDAYASRGGYHSGRDAQVITYHSEFGEVGRSIISPEMVAYSKEAA